MLSTHIINLGQYISTKINAYQHECNKHFYRAYIDLIIYIIYFCLNELISPL
jgi:hypothetical protein